MQELIFHIAYMERRKYQDEQTHILGGMNDCIMYDAIVIQNRIIEELTKEYSEYLEKEKEQIIDAGNGGFLINFLHREKIAKMSDDELRDSLVEDTISYGEEYYNQTYNQNK